MEEEMKNEEELALQIRNLKSCFLQAKTWCLRWMTFPLMYRRERSSVW